MSETVAVSRTAHTFGERFEALLRQNHETSAAAAAKLGVSVAIVAKWRLGKVIPQWRIPRKNRQCIPSIYRLLT